MALVDGTRYAAHVSVLIAGGCEPDARDESFAQARRGAVCERKLNAEVSAGVTAGTARASRSSIFQEPSGGSDVGYTWGCYDTIYLSRHLAADGQPDGLRCRSARLCTPTPRSWSSRNILLIPGISSLTHLRENLAAAELKLSPQTLVELDGIAAVAAEH